MGITRRRRKSDFEEPRPSWKALPHYILYPCAGFFVGVGSPIGAFLLRYWLADPILKSLWVRHELQYNFLFYAYMGIGTVMAFMLFGYVLGVRSERQRVSNRILSARLAELHLKSVTDSLTGTYTHGYLHEILELEIQRALTNKNPLSAMILDIDDFKKINDTHGHLFGDRVIKETAETIVTNVRSEDILGRYGGDEFLVIMPGAEHAVAKQVATRICHAIAKNGYSTTVSIGVSTFSGDEKQGAKDLLHQADLNLYQAKRDGKNQVRASPLNTRLNLLGR
ncbi:MAG: diguanylate cyclase [Elusimicrobia bacterium]|nr:diguanylate cyclase [Elusimicrobiota bacterium]